MDAKTNVPVVPGDVIGRLTATQTTTIRLGQGLIQDGDTIIATKAGILRFRAPDKYYIEASQKRYTPAVDDVVIGIVTEKLGEGWKVDIGTTVPATLSLYAFEGATKRNRPTLAVGSLVYARMIVANKDMEPEISCMTGSGKAEGFGPLNGGYMIKTSTGLARQCLAADNVVLQALGKSVPFEIAVGVNGRVWVNTGSVDHTILVSNCIINSEHMTPSQVRLMVQELLERTKSWQ